MEKSSPSKRLFVAVQSVSSTGPFLASELARLAGPWRYVPREESLSATSLFDPGLLFGAHSLAPPLLVAVPRGPLFPPELAGVFLGGSLEVATNSDGKTQASDGSLELNRGLHLKCSVLPDHESIQKPDDELRSCLRATRKGGP